MENEKINKIAEIWKALNKTAKLVISIIIAVVILIILCVSCSGKGKKVKTSLSKDTLEIFLEHNGEDFLRSIPKNCKKSVIDYYNVSEDELEKNITTYAFALYGKAYSWDFSIEDKQYDVKAKKIDVQDGGSVTLKELQEWQENSASSTESLNAFAAKDHTLRKINSIAEIWEDILNIKDICIVNYTYDLNYVENKTGNKGCDENTQTGLTFIKYKGDWYCLDIIDIVANGLQTNANNDRERENWNNYFGTWE